MFTCERCGSAYGANHIGVEHCPRCRLRDRVQAPLSFKVFKLPDAAATMTTRPPSAPGQPMQAASASAPPQAEAP